MKEKEPILIRNLSRVHKISNAGGVHQLHPFPAFVWYMVTLMFAMLLFHPIFLISSLLIMVVMNDVQGNHKWRKLAPLYVMIGLFIIVINPLFSHRGSHIWFYFLDNPITLEAIIYGVTLALSIMTILFLFISFEQVIHTQKLMYLFGNIAPKTSLLLVMALRFVSILLRRLREIAAVQRTRGIDIRSGGWRKRIRDGADQLQILLTWSLEEALETADSIQARGYGRARRSHYHRFRMGNMDWLFLVLILMTASVCLVGWLMGYGELFIYPRLGDWGFTSGHWITYLSYCLLLLIPLLVEGKDVLKWQWYK